MSPAEGSSSDPPRSAVWLWGFWLVAAVATAAFVLSLNTPYPLDRLFRVVAGVLFVAGGVHNGRVVAYMRATRAPYSTFGPDALITQRQTGWSAIVLGLILIGSAIVGL